MDSPPLQVNEALWNQNLMSMESHPNYLQQLHVNVATPHLPSKAFESRNLKSMESHQLHVNLATPYLSSPQETTH
jgi:hypothetical protein